MQVFPCGFRENSYLIEHLSLHKKLKFYVMDFFRKCTSLMKKKKEGEK